MSLECGECERDIRGGHDTTCSQYVRLVCKCSHLLEEHDEEGDCDECGCFYFVAARKGKSTSSDMEADRKDNGNV